uniref:BTB domain-containing protein n=1 Tax=Strongyloides venezuelensis TaxID=75913 RepID=A0A0K0F697_STRVS
MCQKISVKGNNYISSYYSSNYKPNEDNKELSDFYKEYIQSKGNRDLKIVLNKENVAKMHSKVFFCFAKNFVHPSNNTIEICNDNITKRIVKIMIEYMYTGKVIFHENEFSSFFYLTKNFGVNDLKNAMEKYILQKKWGSTKHESSKKKVFYINERLNNGKNDEKKIITGKSCKNNTPLNSLYSKIDDTLSTSHYKDIDNHVLIPDNSGKNMKFSDSVYKQKYKSDIVFPLLVRTNNPSEKERYGEKVTTKITKPYDNQSKLEYSKKKTTNKKRKKAKAVQKSVNVSRYIGR